MMQLGTNQPTSNTALLLAGITLTSSTTTAATITITTGAGSSVKERLPTAIDLHVSSGAAPGEITLTLWNEVGIAKQMITYMSNVNPAVTNADCLPV